MNTLSLITLQAAPGAGSMNYIQFILLGGIFVVMYFFMIRPQAKKAKEQAQFQDTLQKGDKIVLNSGLHGKIVSVEEKSILIEVDSNVKMRFEKGFISMEMTKALQTPAK